MIYTKTKLDTITDVPNIQVGHFTYKDINHNTGITLLKLNNHNLFQNKLQAATYTYNGFGKSIGFMQINELNTLESDIVLTNTFNVGKLANALVERTLENNEDIGLTTSTFNSVVLECNDSNLNDIRRVILTKEHLDIAYNNVTTTFELGSVGAGAGMVCFGYKGGIGSASTNINIDDNVYTLGVLVNTNFGSQSDFIYSNSNIITEDKGSINIILATNAPLTPNDLRRIAKRAFLAQAQLGSYCGNGSGDIALAFSTTNIHSHYKQNQKPYIQPLHENDISKFFKATVIITKRAILKSLLYANTTTHKTKTIKSINEYKEVVKCIKLEY